MRTTKTSGNRDWFWHNHDGLVSINQALSRTESGCYSDSWKTFQKKSCKSISQSSRRKADQTTHKESRYPEAFYHYESSNRAEVIGQRCMSEDVQARILQRSYPYLSSEKKYWTHCRRVEHINNDVMNTRVVFNCKSDRKKNNRTTMRLAWMFSVIKTHKWANNQHPQLEIGRMNNSSCDQQTRSIWFSAKKICLQHRCRKWVDQRHTLWHQKLAETLGTLSNEGVVRFRKPVYNSTLHRIGRHNIVNDVLRVRRQETTNRPLCLKIAGEGELVGIVRTHVRNFLIKGASNNEQM